MSDPQYDTARAVQEWSNIPTDGIGEYFSNEYLLSLNMEQLRQLVYLSRLVHSATNQWRNRNNGWRNFMRLEHIAGKTVMDYGCGLGVDGLEFALAGAEVVLADISPITLLLAQSTLSLYKKASRAVIALFLPPYLPDVKLDLFWAAGVMHHTPHARDILRRATELLTPDGEIRLLLYSDVRWREMMQEEPPAGPTHEHPRFMEFVRRCDSVGQYTDWYNKEKVEQLVNGFGIVTECTYIADNQLLAVAIKKATT